MADEPDIQREVDLGGGAWKEVTIKPPAARLRPEGLAAGLEVPWEDLYKDAMAQIEGYKREKSELTAFGRQVSSLALSMAKVIVDARLPEATEDTVTIPKELYEQTIGAGITVGTDREGNPFVKIRERGKERVTPAQ